MKPYYKDGHCTIYHGNCKDILPLLDPSDLIVMDPPFDMWRTVRSIFEKGRREKETVICFTSPKHRGAVEDIYGTPRYELIWHFDDGRWVSAKGPRITHENIMVYGETGPADVGERIVDRRPVKKGKGSIGKDVTEDRVYKPRLHKHLDSVLHYPRNVSAPLGVWSKPLPLMSTLIKWVNPRSIVDPFMGSGTTLLAAKNLGYRAIGIELKEECCEMAVDRLRQEVLNL